MLDLHLYGYNNGKKCMDDKCEEKRRGHRCKNCQGTDIVLLHFMCLLLIFSLTFHIFLSCILMWAALFIALCPVWARGNPAFCPYSFISPLPHLLLYLLVSFTFSFFPFLLASSVFLLFHPFHSTRILPLHFQAGCRRRRLNLALVFCVLILCYMYFKLSFS